MVSLREAAKRLKRSDTPLLDARVLLSHVLGRDAAFVFRPLTPDEEARFDALLARREAGEPVAYIVGEKEFMGLPFLLNKATLIPRPDTETLVEYLIEAYKGQSPRALDLCCGSGCIGISLCRYLPGATVVLADVSPEALDAASENLSLHSLGGMAEVKRLDVFSDGFGEGYDIVVSNPPYIPSAEAAALDVARCEPILALDGGETGLDFYRAITPKAFAALKSGGRLVYETGYDQSGAVAAILTENGFTDIVIKKDYGGNCRMAAGLKP